MLQFKEAVVTTEIILEIIINKYTQSEFRILGFGELCDFCFSLSPLSFSTAIFKNFYFETMSNLEKSCKNGTKP